MEPIYHNFNSVLYCLQRECLKILLKSNKYFFCFLVSLQASLYCFHFYLTPLPVHLNFTHHFLLSCRAHIFLHATTHIKLPSKIFLWFQRPALTLSHGHCILLSPHVFSLSLCSSQTWCPLRDRAWKYHWSCSLPLSCSGLGM